jgi:hypothetical protein
MHRVHDVGSVDEDMHALAAKDDRQAHRLAPEKELDAI